MQIEKMTNVTMLRSMLDAVIAQINRTSEEESDYFNELICERDRVMARITILTSGE